MKRWTSALAGLALAAWIVPPAEAHTASGKSAAAATAPRTVTLTANDKMQFSAQTIAARPGERLRVVLKNVGSMPKLAMAHNVVVLTPGTDAAAFVGAGATERDSDFIDPDQKDKVVAATPLAGPGESVEVTFIVPRAGTYAYVCTFPGHLAAGMSGTLVVR